jgi:carbon-monoxide dehydrogenase small subunit
MKSQIQLIINGRQWEGEVTVGQTLLELLRDNLGLTGAKKGCDGGECGACVVLLNGEPVNSCLVLAADLDGDNITTIEGLNDEESRIIKDAYVKVGAVQCGFCAPGMVMATKGLLDENPNPTKEDVSNAMVGHLCRCTGYLRTYEAVQDAASRLNEYRQDKQAR